MHAQPLSGARSRALCVKPPLVQILYERTGKALTRQRRCAGSPEPYSIDNLRNLLIRVSAFVENRSSIILKEMAGIK